MPRYCFIDWCRKTSYKNPNRKLIRFPKNTKTFLCDQHFPKDFFGKKKLKESSYEKIQNLLIEKGVRIPLEPLAEKIKENKRKYSRRCIIKHCNMTDTSAVKFAIFPKENSKLFDIWVEKCDLSMEDRHKVYKYVCEKHFRNQGDDVPNCNLTAYGNDNDLNKEAVAAKNHVTLDTDKDKELSDYEQTSVISSLNVTVIEDFARRQPIKQEPELSIDDYSVMISN